MINKSLVLSGGSALGLAHLGVVKYIQFNNIFIDEVIGTSMGAIVSALYATNSLNETIENDVSSLSKWLSYNFLSKNFIETNRIEKLLVNALGEKTFNDTDIDLKIIATSVETGESICFSKDNNCLIKDAVLASMAIPGVFPVKNIDNKGYIDGFVSENLPVSYAEGKVIFAVDVISENSLDEIKTNTIFFRKTRLALAVYERAIKLLILNQTKHNIEKKRKTGVSLYHLKPNLKGYKNFDFSKKKEIEKIGYIYIKSFFETEFPDKL